MTKKFDERARQELAMVYKPRDFSGVRISSLEVRPIPAKYARPYIATFHYSRTMPDSTRFSFGLFHEDRIVGVCTFGMGCGKNQYTSVIPDIQNGQYIELTRLWLEDTIGRNGESYFISRCIRMLPREIRLVISFSDEKQGHVGTIYQAANFAYLGKNGGGRMLMGQDGIEKHPRLLGIYRMRHPEYKDYTNAQLMELLGYRYIQGGGQSTSTRWGATSSRAESSRNPPCRTRRRSIMRPELLAALSDIAFSVLWGAEIPNPCEVR